MSGLMRRLTLLLGLVCAPATVHAQFQHCEQILQHGIWEIEKSSSDSQFQKSFANWFCNQNFSSEQNFNEIGASLSIPIGAIPATFGGNSRSEKWNEYYSSACGNQTEFISELNSSSFFKQTASPAIVAAWEACAAGSRSGLVVTRVYTSQENVFRLAFGFNSDRVGDAANDDTATISELRIAEIGPDSKQHPVACSGIGVNYDAASGRATGISLPDRQKLSLRCVRDPCKTTYIDMAADRVVSPQPSIEIAGTCWNPIPNCVKYTPDRKFCVRCEFRMDVASPHDVVQERICGNMAPGASVMARYTGDVVVTNPIPATSCQMSQTIRIDTQPFGPSVLQVNNERCRFDGAISSPFATPSDSAHVSAALLMGGCQSGGDPSKLCRYDGTLAIFTPDGQK